MSSLIVGDRLDLGPDVRTLADLLAALDLEGGGLLALPRADVPNDAPTLKAADTGVAMGRRGSEVAKEAAVMVITDDNFASIVEAIRQGRDTYANMGKSVTYMRRWCGHGRCIHPMREDRMPTKIERILVPVDFSSCSEAALAYAVGLARLVGARVDVLHAWEAPGIPADLPLPVEEFQAGARGEAEKLLEELVGRHRTADVRIRAHLATGGAVSTILGRTVTEGHDLIVMGTHGRRGLVRAVLGSVAEEVLRRATCPILCVREPVRP